MRSLLQLVIEKDASDLHLVPGLPPILRIYGSLIVSDLPSLINHNIKNLIYSILNEEQINALETHKELDFAYTHSNQDRFRGNILYHHQGLSAAFRHIPREIPTIEELGLPKGVKDLCQLSRGLILVTGPAGSGKSTTLAAMLDYMNRYRALNIITMEDPIEYIHHHQRSIIVQREIGRDTHTYVSALHHSLRHDPNVIMMGEIRDPQAMATALTAAETGHLILTTIHVPNAPSSINRIIDSIDRDKRPYVRHQLANTLQGIIAQQLIPKSSGTGRVAAVELMLATSAVRNMIREGKEHQLQGVIQTGHSFGMQSMDQSLYRLFLKGDITKEDALKHSMDKREMELLFSEV